MSIPDHPRYPTNLLSSAQTYVPFTCIGPSLMQCQNRWVLHLTRSPPSLRLPRTASRLRILRTCSSYAFQSVPQPPLDSSAGGSGDGILQPCRPEHLKSLIDCHVVRVEHRRPDNHGRHAHAPLNRWSGEASETPFRSLDYALGPTKSNNTAILSFGEWLCAPAPVGRASRSRIEAQHARSYATRKRIAIEHVLHSARCPLRLQMLLRERIGH